MVQYALPDADSHTNWSQGAGDGDADAFDELDEGFGAGRGSGSGPDDATTYWLTTVDLAELQGGMSPTTDPGVTTGHIARMRTRKSAAGGQQQDHKVTLMKSIAVTHGNSNFVDVSEVWTTREHTWDGTTGAPFDYSAGGLVYCTVDEVGGGAGREGHCSALEFECPDPSGGQPYYVRTGGVPGMRIGRPGSVFGRSW